MEKLFSKKAQLIISIALFVFFVALLFVPTYYNGFFDIGVSLVDIAKDNSSNNSSVIVAGIVVACLSAAAVILLSQISIWLLLADIGTFLFLIYEPLKGYVSYKKRPEWPDTALTTGFYLAIVACVLIISYICAYAFYEKKIKTASVTD